VRIGVVVPVRDEAAALPRLVESLRPFFDAGDAVIVVDDGSTDASATTARDSGAEILRVAQSGRGSAIRVGVGAIQDRVDVVVVLHADMRVPATAREALLRCFREDETRVGGAFGHRIDDPRLRFRLVEWGNRFRARYLGIPYGDQAQFFRVESLQSVGGFPRQQTLEDLELALRLRRAGTPVYLDVPVWISARHWSRGVVLTTLRNWWTAGRYLVERSEG
jgi:glycosyltransferase involved in cell wall biosynthesis